VAKKFVKSAKSVGHQYVDGNSDQEMGVSYAQQTTKMGKRMTSAKAYLEPIAYRHNLHVLQFGKVTHVAIDKGEK